MTLQMNKFVLAAWTLVLMTAFAAPAFSQKAGKPDFAIRDVQVSFEPSPSYSVNTPNKQATNPGKWMIVEVTFDAKPDFTDELAFNYYILFANHLLVGHVNHISIEKGRGLHSVAYVSPKGIAKLLQGHQFTASDLANVSVTITQPGIAAPIAMGSYKPSRGEWWATMKQEEGFVVNKSETPFAPLFWDYYEALKPASAR